MQDQAAKFFLYARKSTDEATRQVLSIEAQLFELRKLAQREGITIEREFIECKTAKQPGRLVFNEMLALIEKGKAQGILAWHPDRLARNMVDGGRIIYLVDLGKIKSLKFPTLMFEPNAHGKFMLSVHFSQGKYYVDNLSETIKRGIQTKLRNGIFPSFAPLGYVNDRVNRCIVPDPAKAPLVRKAFELYATGDYALAELRSRINGLGLMGRREMRLSINNYHKMLRNPVYYGMIRCKGEMYDGKHEPIITKALFDRVQEVMKAKSKAKTPQLKPFLYRGLFRCGECGCFITTETQKSHNYLRCTKRKGACSQRFLREESASLQLADTLARLAVPADWPDRMLSALDAERAAWTEARAAQVAGLKADLAACEKKLDTLLDLMLGRAIAQEEYTTKKQMLLGEKTAIREKLAKLESDTTNRFEPAEEFISGLKRATFLASQGTVEEKRDFLKKHGSNFQLRDQTVSVDFVNPWKIVLEATCPASLPSPFTAKTSSNVEWRCIWDKVRSFLCENSISESIPAPVPTAGTGHDAR